MPHIFWLVFCKGQTVGERECVESPHYLSEQPQRSPQGAALRNKNSMCGTQCVCLFVCIMYEAKSWKQLRERRRCLMIKTLIIRTANDSSVRESELKLLKLKTSIRAQMASITLIMLHLRLPTPTQSLILPLISAPSFFIRNTHMTILWARCYGCYNLLQQ